LNNFQWSNERGQPKRVGGKYDIDALTLLTAKMDAMTQKLDKLNVHAVNSCSPSPLCDKCGSLDHVSENCQVGNPFSPPYVEHVVLLVISNLALIMTHILILTTMVGNSTLIFHIGLARYLFPRPMLGLHLDFKDHPFHLRLHPLKSLTCSPC